MIKVLLKNHEIKNDIFELIRVFLPWEEIEILENETDTFKDGIFIISSLENFDGKLYSFTEVYRDDKLISRSEEDIESVNIYGDSIDKNVRIATKKSLYKALIKITDNEIPWGILTGIRPVKIVHELLNKGIEDEEIVRVLKEEYKLYDSKAKLILDIGKRQRVHIYPLNKDRFSLYISIPFCPTRCLYCSFPTLPLGRFQSYINEYVSKLIYEIRSIKDLMDGKEINTVYIGGGTPTAIPAREMEKIIQEIYNSFGEENIKEFTVEAGRPDTITEEYLKVLKSNKINRISINPQTMNNNTLKLIGRQHSAEDIIKTYNMAKEIDFPIINMDLIIGLPGEGVNDIQNTLREIRKLDPENLTVHTLSVKRGSKFRNTMEDYNLESQDTIGDMLNKTIEYSKDMGLIPYYLYRQKQILGNYENIGYAKPNMECIYNIAIMEEKETIIGAGMGAVSKVFFPDENRIERIPNFRDIIEYIERIDEQIIKKRNIFIDL
ncbi:MAG: coproporphyrinogen dehydrogenase HemZ [Tissierellia bacterium]|nr:coproporphyrinogen dehydrogenase HemZ [Tissierellia bacterium]